MYTERLYKYLADGRGLDEQGRKYIRNIANYAEKIRDREERMSFIRDVTEGMYAEDKKPEISVEKLEEIENRPNMVRIKKIIEKHSVHFLYTDIELEDGMTAEAAVEIAKKYVPTRWKKINRDEDIDEEKITYETKDVTDIVAEEREAAMATTILYEDPQSGNRCFKEFRDLKIGDIIFHRDWNGRVEKKIIKKEPFIDIGSKTPLKNNVFILACGSYGGSSRLTPNNLVKKEDMQEQ